MPSKGFDPEAFALALIETGNATEALKQSGIVPDSDEYDMATWYKRTAERYRKKREVKEALTRLYTERAQMDYADCLPLAAGAVKQFLLLKDDNPKTMKAQADLGAKILGDAKVVLSPIDERKLPVNKDELLDELARLIHNDKDLVGQIVRRGATVVDVTPEQPKAERDSEQGSVLPTVPEAT